MPKHFGLACIHTKLIDAFMDSNREALGARHIIDRLFESFKRSPPTRRQVGIYLKLNPHYTLIENGSHGRLYRYSSER